MKEKIEKAIRETLVIENKQSIHYAVDRIMKLISEDVKQEEVKPKEINRQ